MRGVPTGRAKGGTGFIIALLHLYIRLIEQFQTNLNSFLEIYKICVVIFLIIIPILYDTEMLRAKKIRALLDYFIIKKTLPNTLL